MASGVILGPNRLLTNMHVWNPVDPWWTTAPPNESEMRSFNREILPKEGEGALKLTLTLGSAFPGTRFRLVAAGDTTVSPDVGDEFNKHWLEDWAVVEADHPLWDPSQQAIIHPPARSLDWQVPEGRELFVLGFATRFLQPIPEEDERAGFSVEAHNMVQLVTHCSQGPHAFRGEATQVEEYPALEIDDLEQIGGHSGGGVYLWNEQSGHLELVGVFHSTLQAPMVGESSWEITPLGISALSFTLRWSRKRTGRYMMFAPIGPILRSLESSE